jgi:hypothetical protein
MALSKKRASTAGKNRQKPLPKRKPVKERVYRTREAILADLTEIVAKVEIEAAKPRTKDLEWQYARSGPLSKLREKTTDLGYELRSTVQHDPLPEEDGLGDSWAISETLIDRAFAAKPGEVPTWTQSGAFLLWAGRIPVLCEWGGWVHPAAAVCAVAPNLPWFKPGGYQSGSASTLPAKALTVDGFFRGSIAAFLKAPDLKLHPLTDNPKLRGECRLGVKTPLDGVRQAVEGHGEWLRLALARGPVQPIQMPHHLPAIQLSFLGA